MTQEQTIALLQLFGEPQQTAIVITAALGALASAFGGICAFLAMVCPQVKPDSSPLYRAFRITIDNFGCNKLNAANAPTPAPVIEGTKP